MWLTELGRPRAVWRVAVVAVLLAVAYALVLQPSVKAVYSPFDKAFHAGVFAVVWGLVAWCWQARAWVVSAACMALGLLVELHQMFLPGFDPSFFDVLANAVGIALAHGVYAVYALHKS